MRDESLNWEYWLDLHRPGSRLKRIERVLLHRPGAAACAAEPKLTHVKIEHRLGALLKGRSEL